MKRSLPLLLLVAAVAVAGCGGADPGPASTARAVQPGTPTPDGTAVKAASTPGAQATPGTEAAPGAQAASAPGTQAAPRFRGRIVAGRDAVRSRVRYSWRRGCPVGPVELRLLQVDHWGLDGRVHRGELIVHRDHARRVLVVLGRLFQARYPIQRLRLVDAYRASDDRSMAANNTSGFNCRRVSGSSRWSEHAFGRAIDVNPLRNPWVTRGGRVSPPAGRPYANRGRRAAGMIHGGDRVVRAFAAAGWRWGGDWSGSKDYQHFSSSGR
jgi:D-alanyl-D-alanine carboxypeptidase